MKRSFLGIFVSGLVVAGLLSFTEPYHPEDPQQRKSKSSKQDTMSDTRINRGNQPALNRTDSLPMPKPKPPVPLPDTVRNMN